MITPVLVIFLNGSDMNFCSETAIQQLRILQECVLTYFPRRVVAGGQINCAAHTEHSRVVRQLVSFSRIHRLDVLAF